MSDDIVKRLREFSNAWLAIRSNSEHIHGINHLVISTTDLDEAANVLERQRELLARALIVMEDEDLDLCGFPEPMSLCKEIAALQETGSE